MATKKELQVASKKALTTKLKDYVHFYIGQTILSYWGERKEYEVIKGVIGSLVILDYNEDDGIQSSVDLNGATGNEKLLLKSLSSLKKDEAKYILDNYSFKGVEMPMDKQKFSIEICKRVSDHAPLMLYLTKKGYDVFGLIDCGLAIEID